MKFSVIIPVYNCEKTLHISVESILQQTFQDWELILVNDGSKDNSLNICNKYANKDSRIKVVNQENTGSGPARNHGIEVSVGEYLLFCDADDFYEATAMEAFNKAIVLHGQPDLVISSYKEFKLDKDNSITLCGKRIAKECCTSDLEQIRKKYVDFHRRSFITAPWAKAYRRELVVEQGISFADLRRCQDVVFNLEFYDVVRNVVGMRDFTYCYQTPDNDSYLKKFPVTMFEIHKKVYDLINEKLVEWGVYDESAKKYFDSRLINDASILLRLNYQNNWNLNMQQQKEFFKKILNDDELLNAEKTRFDGIKSKLICFVLKTKSITIVNMLSKATLVYQKGKKKNECC